MSSIPLSAAIWRQLEIADPAWRLPFGHLIDGGFNRRGVLANTLLTTCSLALNLFDSSSCAGPLSILGVPTAARISSMLIRNGPRMAGAVSAPLPNIAREAFAPLWVGMERVRPKPWVRAVRTVFEAVLSAPDTPVDTLHHAGHSFSCRHTDGDRLQSV